MPTVAMLPVASSAPAITTSISPTVNTAPVTSTGTLPHAFGIPAEATTASSAPNAMYAPARKPPVSVLPKPCFALTAPASAVSSGISCGGMNAMCLLWLDVDEDLVAADLDRVRRNIAALVADGAAT